MSCLLACCYASSQHIQQRIYYLLEKMAFPESLQELLTITEKKSVSLHYQKGSNDGICSWICQHGPSILGASSIFTFVLADRRWCSIPLSTTTSDLLGYFLSSKRFKPLFSPQLHWFFILVHAWDHERLSGDLEEKESAAEFLSLRSFYITNSQIRVPTPHAGTALT